MSGAHSGAALFVHGSNILPDIYGPQFSLVPDAPGGQPQHQQFDDDAWASETWTNPERV
jgi:hypothetical protein